MISLIFRKPPLFNHNDQTFPAISSGPISRGGLISLLSITCSLFFSVHEQRGAPRSKNIRSKNIWISIFSWYDCKMNGAILQTSNKYRRRLHSLLTLPTYTNTNSDSVNVRFFSPHPFHPFYTQPCNELWFIHCNLSLPESCYGMTDYFSFWRKCNSATRSLEKWIKKWLWFPRNNGLLFRNKIITCALSETSKLETTQIKDIPSYCICVSPIDSFTILFPYTLVITGDHSLNNGYVNHG